MDKDTTLNDIIRECHARFSTSGAEFDPDDVLAEVMRNEDAWRPAADRLARNFIRRLITAHCKSNAGEDMTDDYPQLALAGFERVPRDVPFYSGGKVKYIAAMSATAAHLRAAIKLREDNISFCAARRDDYQRMLDLILHSGSSTFGDAVTSCRETARG